MIDLITLDEAKAHLGITFDHDDIYLESIIQAASLMVLEHIDGDESTYDSPDVVPVNVKHAVKLLVGFYDENRAGEGWKEMRWATDAALGGLPPAVVALLSSLHKPVMQ